jgi:hypothetical protein
MTRPIQRQAAKAACAAATLPHHCLANWQHAFAAALVAASSLVPAGLSGGSWESRAHEQVNQLLRVINRLVRQKSNDRELQAAKGDRRVRIYCSGRQPSELRYARFQPPLAPAKSST